ncbi:hypothetical protein BDN72DRAFT_901536 [Pluteus cervinus]|uniref:Uncharacterized protein n=1 Tax=Pluteus cervinus TaxID=181527 RepID=A0ACD3AHZ0_9AGAR|nr:hypothetical protein BDN72DRAFT_901536 [Pluteus cervinus]
MSNHTLPFDIKRVVTIYKHMELDMHVAFAAATIYLYDLLLTLGLEVELIWSSKWCFLKAIYLIQRYLPLVDTLLLGRYQLFKNAELCERFVKASAHISVIGVMLSEIILIRRAIAIWGNKRRWWIGLYTLFIISFVPLFTAVELFLRGLTFTAIDLPHEHCFIGRGSQILLICWITVTIFDAGIFIAMAIPGFQYYRIHGTNSDLQKTVFRDGILYIFYLFILSMINVAVIIKWPTAHAGLLSSRVVLHIRAQLHQPNGPSSNDDSDPILSSLAEDMTFSFRNTNPDVDVDGDGDANVDGDVGVDAEPSATQLQDLNGVDGGETGG